MSDQTCTYRVADDVSYRQCDLLMIAKDAFISISLPESLTARLAVVETGVLLRCLDESPAVRIVPFTLDYEMEVVGHEAVRNRGKVLLSARTQYLEQYRVDDVFCDEQRATSIDNKS